VEAPLVWLAGGAGIWLFYVQHQFDHTYWRRSPEWSYEDAALRGSSYLQLPKVLQFFTGNIGLHHVHHLNSKIPNYNLQRAHDGVPIFHGVPIVSLGDGLRATRLKLWDEVSARLVTWREVRRGSRWRSWSLTVEFAKKALTCGCETGSGVQVNILDLWSRGVRGGAGASRLTLVLCWPLSGGSGWRYC
jgi:hypothetical protein